MSDETEAELVSVDETPRTGGLAREVPIGHDSWGFLVLASVPDAVADQWDARMWRPLSRP